MLSEILLIGLSFLSSLWFFLGEFHALLFSFTFELLVLLTYEERRKKNLKIFVDWIV